MNFRVNGRLIENKKVSSAVVRKKNIWLTCYDYFWIEETRKTN